MKKMKFKIFKFRNCPCILFGNIGYGLIPMFEENSLTEDENEFFLMRFSSKSYKYEDMNL